MLRLSAWCSQKTARPPLLPEKGSFTVLPHLPPFSIHYNIHTEQFYFKSNFDQRQILGYCVVASQSFLNPDRRQKNVFLFFKSTFQTIDVVHFIKLN
jgi:hypothetical protein